MQKIADNTSLIDNTPNETIEYIEKDFIKMQIIIFREYNYI